MGLEIIILSDASQTEKDKIPYDAIQRSNLKYARNEFMKQKQTHRQRKQTYGYQKGEGVEER